MRTPSSALQHHITTLSDAYHQLSPFWTFFYPRAVSQAIAGGNPLTIAQSAVNNTWFFQRWFFSSLNTFLSAAPVRSAQFILKNQACLNALSSTTNPLAVIDAMVHYKATTGYTAAVVCRNIISIFSNTYAHVREQILLSLDELGLLNGLLNTSNTSQYQAEINLREAATVAPESLLKILTTLKENVKRNPSMMPQAIQTEFSRLKHEANATIQAEANAQRERPGLSLQSDDQALRKIARHTESSMMPLTSPEQKGMSRLLEHYRGKSSSSLDIVNAALRARYLAQPAFITRNSGTFFTFFTRTRTQSTRINLPLDKASFNRLSLSATERQEALKQYYQHKTHTALRYLMQPNPWNGRSAQLNERQRQNIALFWQAVSDETTPAVDGYTIEGRIETFIMGLADIGRAHNWDSSRHNWKTRQMEDYDDLKPDRPSCVSGVDTRLYRTIQGHPLTQGGLTFEIADQELNDFVREHFSTSIRALDATAKKNLKNHLIEYVFDVASASEDVKENIETLNVPPEAQQRFLTFMSNKYREAFTDQFITHVELKFIFTPNFPSHFMRFQATTNIMSVFDETSAPTLSI